MGDVFNLLMKARRDTSRLVQVQRTVTRGGKTFTQNYWVSHSQVRDTGAPRTRGDDPRNAIVSGLLGRCSPHTRG